MTSRKNATRPLLQAPPDDPQENVIAYMVLPDSVEYKRTLLGLIKTATTFLNYTRSGTNRESQVAKIWRDVYMTIAFDLCLAVANCISNDQRVKDAMSNVLAENNNLPNNNSDNPIKGSPSDSNVLEGINCDFDTLYGVAVAIEDYIYQSARDFFEIITDSAVDSIAKLRLVDYTPIVGDLPGTDDINDLISQVRLFGLTAFDVGYNVQIRQDNICRLFNMMCNDCELTGSDIASSYILEALPSWDMESQFWFFVQFVVAGTWTETQIVRLYMGLVASVLSVGGELLGRVGIEGFKTIAQSGNPDGDWELFCDPCAVPCALPVFIDFESPLTSCETIQRGSIQSGFGYNSDNALRDSASGANTVGANIRIDFDTPQPTVSVTAMHYVQTNGQTNQGNVFHIYYDANDNVVYSYESGSITSAGWTQRQSSYLGGNGDVSYVRVLTMRTTTNNAFKDVRTDNVNVTS